VVVVQSVKEVYCIANLFEEANTVTQGQLPNALQGRRLARHDHEDLLVGEQRSKVVRKGFAWACSFRTMNKAEPPVISLGVRAF
jgi:hypothetical protein